MICFLLTSNNTIGDPYAVAIASLVSRPHSGNCDNICLHSWVKPVPFLSTVTQFFVWPDAYQSHPSCSSLYLFNLKTDKVYLIKTRNFEIISNHKNNSYLYGFCAMDFVKWKTANPISFLFSTKRNETWQLNIICSRLFNIFGLPKY